MQASKLIAHLTGAFGMYAGATDLVLTQNPGMRGVTDQQGLLVAVSHLGLPMYIGAVPACKRRSLCRHQLIVGGDCWDEIGRTMNSEFRC